MPMTPDQHQDAARLALTILERDYDQGRIPTAVYLAQRKALIRQALGQTALPVQRQYTTRQALKLIALAKDMPK